MQKAKPVLIIIAIISALILLAAGIYYFWVVSQGVKIVSTADVTPRVELPKPPPPPVPPPSAEKQLETINQNYPQIIKGTISFLDTKNYFKTTIKTNDGTVYTLWPSEPESVYESFGAKNGGMVQVNGKLLDNNNLGWALMKPI